MSRPVGAIFVLDKQIIATGYNGATSKAPHCCDEGSCYRRGNNVQDSEKRKYCRSIHAEANGIKQAKLHNIDLNGSSLYVTLSPCCDCLKLLENNGVQKVFYEYLYDGTEKVSSRIKQEQVRLSKETKKKLCSNINNVTSLRLL
jgi:dCMP deaminase